MAEDTDGVASQAHDEPSTPAPVRLPREVQAGSVPASRCVIGTARWDPETGEWPIELVQVCSVAELVAQDGPLGPQRASAIALGVAAVLEQAHRFGVVHGHLSAQAVQVTSAGRVIVTGLAATPTVPGGDAGVAIAGLDATEVAYRSPEQLQGAPPDAASDLYALGILLYEMLAGEVPFTGERPMQVALGHLQERPIPLRSRGVAVAESLEAITHKLQAKLAANRYPTAADVVADLRRYRAGRHRLHPAPVPPAPPRTPPEPVAATAAGHRRSGLVPVLLVQVLIGSLVAILVGWGDGSSRADTGPDAEEVAVPLVIGMDQDRAIAVLESAGFEAVVEQQRNLEHPPGSTFDQDPYRGVRVERGSEVRVWVSLGADGVHVPMVIGSQVDDAERRLRDLGFEVRRVSDPDSPRPEGEVGGQSPLWEYLVPGAVVELSFSDPPERLIPDLAGEDPDDAVEQLEELGFEVQQTQGASSWIPQGRVIRTDPPADTLYQVRQLVTVVVSTGPPRTSMPQVVGLSEPAAADTLNQRGLRVIVRTQEVPEGDEGAGQVLTQEPSAGSWVVLGREVLIVVGEVPAGDGDGEGGDDESSGDQDGPGNGNGNGNGNGDGTGGTPDDGTEDSGSVDGGSSDGGSSDGDTDDGGTDDGGTKDGGTKDDTG